MKRSWVVLVCALAAATPRPAATQGQGPPDTPTGTSGRVFRSSADLVALNVVVTDSSNRFVSGLSANDFVVLEDGVPQDVSFFAARDVPLDLALLVDTSASMLHRLPVVQQAARGLLKTLRDGDQVMVVDIKGSMRILYPLGPDMAAAEAAVGSIAASGGTGLYNALYAIHKELVKGRPASPDPSDVRRRAIVVLSDARDTSSLMSLDDVLDSARLSGIATYTITLEAPRGFGLAPTESRVLEPAEYGMKTLAQETGARAFFPRGVDELKDIYEAIASELAHQYAIAYTSTSAAAGDYRRIEVKLPERPELRARTRSGYTPPRPARARAME